MASTSVSAEPLCDQIYCRERRPLARPNNMLSYVLPIVVPAFFLGFWCFVLWALSALGGWNSLAGVYPARERSGGATYYMQTGFVGAVCYRSCLNFRVSPAGLYLSIVPLFRFAHPPLLIPWSDIGSPLSNAGVFLRLVEVPVGRPTITRISLPSAVIQSAIQLQYCDEATANNELPQSPASLGHLR